MWQRAWLWGRGKSGATVPVHAHVSCVSCPQEAGIIFLLCWVKPQRGRESPLVTLLASDPVQVGSQAPDP